MNQVGNIRSTSRTDQPPLRLVCGEREPTWRTSVAFSSNEAREVAKENLLSSDLTADDAHLLFAARVGDALEGGRAAILSPIRRRELVAAAVASGLRPFDANLVIAIVQEAAREGSNQSTLDRRLAILQKSPRSSRETHVALLLAITLAAMAIFFVLRLWLLS